MGQPPMADYTADRLWSHLPPIPDDKPVLIAGPTASGKSALALMIAEHCGGVVVNADASQVYACWRVISARPSREEEARTPHLLYGHIAYDQTYSAGHWLREVTPLLRHKPRPIIVGGTGLYLSALTEGMAIIPATPPEIRAQADARSLEDLIDGIDVKRFEGWISATAPASNARGRFNVQPPGRCLSGRLIHRHQFCIRGTLFPSFLMPRKTGYWAASTAGSIRCWRTVPWKR